MTITEENDMSDDKTELQFAIVHTDSLGIKMGGAGGR